MVQPISRLLSLIACASVFQFAISATAQAELRVDDDYIALVFEAEDDDTRSERWVLTNAATPAIEPDPDPNHSDGASGGAYLELLPDYRVTEHDPLYEPTALWNRGDGPQAHYTMDFPEAGRYYVHIRAFSTGTEDNGIHVGLNGQFPLTGAQMQWCTANAGWQWRGRKRDSGGGACGIKKSVWITVEEPGENTFMISAREDGFEADSIMLIKDLSNNTRICSPSGIDDITCVNGSLNNPDELVNLAVTTTIDQTAVDIQETVAVSVDVRNTDDYDTASNVVLSVGEGIGTQWEAVSVDDACQLANGSMVCDLGDVLPSAPEAEMEPGDFEYNLVLLPLQSGSLNIPVSIETSSEDNAPNNNTSNDTVEVSDDSLLSSLAWTLTGGNLDWQVDSATTVVATAVSNGAADATGVQLTATVPSGLAVTNLPTECIGVSRIVCNVGNLAQGAQVSLSFGLTPSSAGLYSISVEADADNLDGAAVGSSIIVQVADEADGGDTGGDPSVGTDTGTDTVPVNTQGGAVLWWTLLMLTALLYSRQIHLSRVQRKGTVRVSAHS